MGDILNIKGLEKVKEKLRGLQLAPHGDNRGAQKDPDKFLEKEKEAAEKK
jgi:hypothetical protein